MLERLDGSLTDRRGSQDETRGILGVGRRWVSGVGVVEGGDEEVSLLLLSSCLTALGYNRVRLSALTLQQPLPSGTSLFHWMVYANDDVGQFSISQGLNHHHHHHHPTHAHTHTRLQSGADNEKYTDSTSLPFE